MRDYPSNINKNLDTNNKTLEDTNIILDEEQFDKEKNYVSLNYKYNRLNHQT